MANNVIVKVAGGDRQIIDGVNTIGELKQKLLVPGHTAGVNGNPASDSDSLKEGDIVMLSPSIKGGC